MTKYTVNIFLRTHAQTSPVAIEAIRPDQTSKNAAVAGSIGQWISGMVGAGTTPSMTLAGVARVKCDGLFF
jgi:hypothetical protein